MYLALQGKAREVVRPIAAYEIGSLEGFDKLIAQLDAVYLKDETTRMFCALKEFYEFRREGGMDFSSFIVEYEKRYHKVKTSSIGDLPTALRAFFLLQTAYII